MPARIAVAKTRSPLTAHLTIWYLLMRAEAYQHRSTGAKRHKDRMVLPFAGINMCQCPESVDLQFKNVLI